MNIVLLLFFGLTPVVIQWAARRWPVIEKVGVVTVCYAAGLVAGNLPGVTIDEVLTGHLIEVVVPLSIPLLLFSSDLKVWRAMGGSMLKGYGSGVVAVVISVLIATFLFQSSLAEVGKLGSMMIGVYTGGTPNMSAIGLALDVEHETFIILNAADLVYGGMYLLVLLSMGKMLFGRLLPFPARMKDNSNFTIDEQLYPKGSSIGLLLAVLILAAAIGLSMLLFGRIDEMTVLIVITSLGILASTNRTINAMRGSFGLGNYLLLVFCVAVGSLANVQNIISSGPGIMAFVGVIIGLTILLHILFARLLHIDSDTFVIASAAGIFGPAFIAPVAKAIKNPLMIPLGLAMSLLGFAIGNYCGLLMYRLLSGVL